MSRMSAAGRNKAASILRHLEGREDEVGLYLSVYDFKGGTNPTKFYLNAHRIMEKLGGRWIQRSVVLCSSRKAAVAISMLAESYGARASTFKVLEIGTD